MGALQFVNHKRLEQQCRPKYFSSVNSLIMEPGRVELPSALASNFPLAHRFSHFVPHGGVYQLALTVRLSGINLGH